jgi:hypothetical protein
MLLNPRFSSFVGSVTISMLQSMRQMWARVCKGSKERLSSLKARGTALKAAATKFNPWLHF